MHPTEIKYQLSVAVNSCESLQITQIAVTKKLLAAALDLIQRQEDGVSKLTKEIDALWADPAHQEFTEE